MGKSTPTVVSRRLQVTDVFMPRFYVLLKREGWQGNRILIFESFLIYQHFHPEPPTPHPEPVEGAPPLLLLDNSTNPSRSPFSKASFLALDHTLICFS